VNQVWVDSGESNGKGNRRSLRDDKQKGNSDGKDSGNSKGSGNSKDKDKMRKLFGEGAVAELA
jgi:hypothetical protein